MSNSKIFSHKGPLHSSPAPKSVPVTFLGSQQLAAFPFMRLAVDIGGQETCAMISCSEGKANLLPKQLLILVAPPEAASELAQVAEVAEVAPQPQLCLIPMKVSIGCLW